MLYSLMVGLLYDTQLREEKWPLILSEAIDNVIKTPGSPLSPTTSFSSVIGGGSDVSGSPSRRRQCTVLCV